MSAPIIPGAEPVSIAASSQDAAVLLLHGYMGTVQTVRNWALAFAQAGFAVEAPLLPGHGTSHEDMVDTQWSDYVDYSDAVYKKLAARYERVFVGGLCMGGPIAASVVTRHPEVAGLLSINGSFQLPRHWNSSFLREMLKDNRIFFQWFRGQTMEDPAAPPLIVYDLAPIAPMLTLRASLEAVYEQLSEVRCPVLAFTSRLDTVLEPDESEPAWLKQFSGPVEHIFLERSRHLATLDYDKEIIETRSVEFVQEILQGKPNQVSPAIA